MSEVGDQRPAPGARLRELLRALAPQLDPGPFAFVSVPPATDLRGLDVEVMVREAEGLTLVLPERQAAARGFRGLFRAARITLTVASDLDAVGLTAAVAGELAAAGVPCNVVAGALHDHLFVPSERAGEALQLLSGLQRRWQRAGDD